MIVTSSILVEARVPLRRRHVCRGNVCLRSVEHGLACAATAATAAAAWRLVRPPPTATADPVEQGPPGRHASADGGGGELVARPDGEVDVLPAGVPERELDQLGEAHDADDADTKGLAPSACVPRVNSSG